MKNKTKTLNISPVVIFITGLVLLLIVQLVIIAQLAQQQDNDVAILKNQAMMSYRQVSEEFGPKQPIVDAAAKRLYLSGLDMYLPLNLDTMDVNYSVTDANGGGTTDLVFSSKLNNSAYSAQTGVAEGCLDLVRAEIGATVSQPRTGEIAQPPFRLDDGRNVYLYLPGSTSKCHEYQLVTPETILNAVKQLHSY